MMTRSRRRRQRALKSTTMKNRKRALRMYPTEMLQREKKPFLATNKSLKITTMLILRTISTLKSSSTSSSRL